MPFPLSAVAAPKPLVASTRWSRTRPLKLIHLYEKRQSCPAFAPNRATHLPRQALTARCAQQDPGAQSRLEQVQQGLQVLHTLRAFSFGGKLKGDNAAKLETLLAYYPSLRVLAFLLKDAALAPGAQAFLSRMSLPHDLHTWLASVLDVAWPEASPQDATAETGDTGRSDDTRYGDQLPSKPCGTRSPSGTQVYDRCLDDSWFDITDAGLEILLAAYGAFGNLLEQKFPHMHRSMRLAALRAYDRVLALGREPGARRSVEHFITSTVAKSYVEGDPAFSMAMAKLCMRVGADPALLQFRSYQHVTSSQSFNEAWVAVKRVSQGLSAPVRAVWAPGVKDDFAGQLATGPLSVSQLSQFFAHGQGVALGVLLPAAVAAQQAGRLQRLDCTTLEATEREQVAAALRGLTHPGCALALVALLLDGMDDALRAVWLEQGYSDEQIAGWQGHMERLRGLPPALLDAALSDVLHDPGSFASFASLPMRLHLVGAALRDSGAVQEAFSRRDCLDDESALRLLGAHVACDSAAQEALLRWLKGANAPRSSALQAVLVRDGLHALLPRVHTQLQEAVQRCQNDNCSAAASALLGRQIAVLSAGLPAALLVREALGALYAADVARVLPLADVDLTDKQARQGRGSGDVVDVAGVALPVSRNPAQDRRAVPRKVEADLVMTPTTQTNLWRLATMVRAGKSVLLEGPTSAGKTAAVRYLAYRSNNPLRRITLSFRTEVADLIGRWVAGVERYKTADLEAMSAKQLAAVAREYGADSTADRSTMQVQILKKQRLPRWVDGLVVQAVRRGEWLILDEINLAPADVIERLNSLFDDDGDITLESGEKIPAHPNFRAFATMNPGNYVGRGQLSDALRSRWARVYCQGLSRADLTQILKARFGEAIPAEEMKKLLVAHSLLSEAADKGSVARNLGGISYSLRNLRNVCERFIAYRGRGLGDAALMRRETEEVYRDGLPPNDVQVVDDVLTAAMPYDGPHFHDNLQLIVDDDSITIGDVTLPRIGPRDPDSRAMLVPTQRTLRLLYRLAKIIERGENALLIGGKASGKTSLVAMLGQLLGQRYQRQMIGPATDTMQLVGSYTTQGWQDGVILQGGRPENTPAITLLDEINFGDSATLERLNGAFEKDDHTVVLTEGDGSVVRLHPQSHVMGAMNPPGEKYGGRKRLSKALQNRMTAVFVPELTEREELQQIVRGMATRKIADAAVAQVVADALLETHHWVAEGYEKGLLGKGLLSADKPVLSIRSLLRALDVTVELMRDMSVGQAFVHAVEVGYASEATEADNLAILQTARRLAA